jgi:hypothetical protein
MRTIMRCGNPFEEDETMLAAGAFDVVPAGVLVLPRVDRAHAETSRTSIAVTLRIRFLLLPMCVVICVPHPCVSSCERSKSSPAVSRS